MKKIDKIKELREITGISVIECKKALEEADYDLEKARLILKSKMGELSAKKSERETKEGIIESYIHPTKKIGAMVEFLSESDFVAKSEDFKKLAHEICLQIAAQNPLFSRSEDIPEDFLVRKRKILKEQLKNSGKPRKIIDQIVENKLKRYKEEISLLSQPWIRNEAKTIKDLIDEYIARVGENIIIKRFVRYEI